MECKEDGCDREVEVTVRRTDGAIEFLCTRCFVERYVVDGELDISKIESAMALPKAEVKNG